MRVTTCARSVVNLAARRGGIYRDPMSALHRFEVERLGHREAELRHRLDRERFAATQKSDERDAKLRKQGELASEVASRLKTIEQAQEEWKAFLAERQKPAEVPGDRTEGEHDGEQIERHEQVERHPEVGRQGQLLAAGASSRQGRFRRHPRLAQRKVLAP
jgi:hypothetical protein